ncbi:MAG: GYD domain-containing protein [Gemmataceae bacterium]
MATYITTIKFTQQGVKSIDETTRRAAAFKAVSKKLGIKIRDVYWTLGAYDGMLVFEAPDDETATGAILRLGALGNVHTTTLRAFNAAEMDKILSKTPTA